jgi:two-component system nitrate/nitrite response regulator NarL
MELEPLGTVLTGPDTLFREGLARILSAANFRILASVPFVDDPLLSSLPQGQPLLLLIDISDDFDATLGQIESFKQRYPAGRVAVLAHQLQLTEMVSAFRMGANACFVKVATCDTFIKSLELVMLGQTILPPAILALIDDQMDVNCNGHAPNDENDPDEAHVDDDEVNDHEDDPEDDDDSDNSEMFGSDVGTYAKVPEANKGRTSRLTARQESILRCLIEGDSNKTIARKMKIAEATVKVHVKAILRKTRVHNRTQAAIWAMINGQFTSVTDDDPPALAKLPVKPSPSLGIAQVLPVVRNNASAALQALKLQRGSHVGLASIGRLVRKSITRKND